MFHLTSRSWAEAFTTRSARNRILSYAIVLLVAGVSGRLHAADLSFELPKESFTLKKSPGVEQMQASCLLCHSTDYISTQPPLTKAQWTATVDKMRTRYGAPIPTNNVPTLVDYLTLNYGKPTPTAK